MEPRNQDKETVIRAQKGDRGALKELMTGAAPVAAALVQALLPWTQDREELVQEALFRAMKNLKSLRDPTLFGAYLNAITRNLVYDRQRLTHRVRPLPDEVAGSEADPAEAVVEKEERERLVKALDGLGELDRKVVLLRHWADASYEEIARTLGLTQSAVQSRLFRARRTLRERMKSR